MADKDLAALFFATTRDHPLRHHATAGKILGLTDGYDLLTQSLEEESRTHELLTKIAETEANATAAVGGA